MTDYVAPPPAAGGQSIFRSNHEHNAVGGVTPADLITDTDLAPAQRLIVLVPDREVDEIELARRIWEIASPHRLAVLFLGLSRSVAEESQLRRRLINLSALTRDPSLKVETSLELGKDWMRHLRTILRKGDVLVFHSHLKLSGRRKPAREILSALDVPLLMLDGYEVNQEFSSSSPLLELAFWIVSIAIVFGFFLLQTKLLRSPEDWSWEVLLSLSVLVEIALLYGWHRLTS